MVFLEVFLPFDENNTSGIEGRDEIEDPLDDALQEAELGEVTGGGSGIQGSNIDIEITNARKLDEALAIIRQVLRSLHVPPSTVIIRHKPTRIVYPVYEDAQ